MKVVSLTENFDLETKEGRFMFTVLAAAAEYANVTGKTSGWKAALNAPSPYYGDRITLH